MQSDEDVSAGPDEEQDTVIPLEGPGEGYITICPDPAYELVWSWTYDFRKKDRKKRPYLVMPGLAAKFPRGGIRVKRLVLCQRWLEGRLHHFLWLADWFEKGEEPSPFHDSIRRVIAKGRRGWGQVVFHRNAYQWYPWPEKVEGPPPTPFWPDRTLYDILQETLDEQIIDTDAHELILANNKQGEDGQDDDDSF